MSQPSAPTPETRAARIRALRATNTVNGIESVEVVSEDQQTLELTFVHPLPGQPGALPAGQPDLTPDQIRFAGGVRVVGVRAVSLAAAGRVLTILTDRAGDFSAYELALVAAPGSDAPPAGMDPVLSRITVNFKVACPSDLDCLTPAALPAPPPAPVIDYLARDWSSFRRAMLDRMSATMPEWQERASADTMIAMVETLAWAADRYAYLQDVVGTETYLDTARRRTSLRRHARLLDYAVHEGCNARTWIAFTVTSGSGADGAALPQGTQIAALGHQAPPVIAPADAEVALRGATVFETMHPAALRAVRSSIALYDWSGAVPMLKAGARSATLIRPPGLNLQPGEVLIFEETASPETGLTADRDRAKRAALRLSAVAPGTDPLDGTAIVTVSWMAEDALPFDLQITAEALIGGVPTVVQTARALGNVVLADHGRSFRGAPGLDPAAPEGERAFRPHLERGDIVWAEPFDPDQALRIPASRLLAQEPRAALPALLLADAEGFWRPRRDLLGADRFAREFVLEPEPGQLPTLRFGDGIHGQPPAIGAALAAQYRVGGGTAGNLGADNLGSVVTALAGITALRNPLPATGGTARESATEIRRYAPQAFRTQRRAVTNADWITAAEAFPEVERARVDLRWTGSWYTVFLTIDRRDGLPVRADADFAMRLLAYLDSYRLAGYDLALRDPVFLPLEIELLVCLAPGYVAGDLRGQLVEVFSSGYRADGQRGLFHPDNFTFGDPLYLSTLYAAALALDGVASVTPQRFRPRGQTAGSGIAAGVLRPDPSAILRCDSDLNRPENGAIAFDVREAP